MDTPAPAQASLREIPKQFPNHRNPQVAIYGGVNAKPSSAHFHIFEAEQVVLAVAAAMGTMKRNTQGGNLLGEWQDVL